MSTKTIPAASLSDIPEPFSLFYVEEESEHHAFKNIEDFLFLFTLFQIITE